MGLWILYPLLVSFLLTVALEGIFALIYGIRDKKDGRLLLLVNLITNPPVVLTYFLVTYYTDINQLFLVIILELIVILTEAHYLKTYGNTYRHPLLFALFVNLFSYGMGQIINILF